ncbi:MAG: malate dehydrogenase [Planctomycetes bacterium]|nr:malate dehydrogenase [Planctomycetota bacterium]
MAGARKKLSVIGAGNVGATCAVWAAKRELADVVLLDIVDGLPQGKGLDLYEASPVEYFDAKITGTTDYADTADSDVVIITSGLARKPGMSRDDLLAVNAKIVAEVAGNVAGHCPQAVLIVVSNPLDAMVAVASEVSGFAHNRVLGQAGVLDSARFRAFVAEAIGCSVKDVSALLLGGHGDDMVPLPRYASAGGVPITQLLSAETIDAIVERTRKGGGEIVGLLKTGSAYYAPAAAAVQMAEAVLRDQKRILPSAVFCDAEYGVGGYFVGVPAILGAAGCERVIEVELTAEERSAFDRSVQHVRELVAKLASIR